MSIDDHGLDPGFLQEAIEIAAAGAVEGIDGNGDLRSGNGGKIDHLAQTGEISRQGIDDTEETGRLRLLQGHLAVADLEEHGIGALFDRFRRRWQRRTAGGRAEFEAVIFCRIMAGGKVDPPGRLPPQEFMGNNRGRGIAVTKEDGNFGANQNFGGFAGKTIPHETGVIADHHPAGSAIDFAQFISDRLSDDFDVGKGKIVTENTAPAGCTERNPHLKPPCMSGDNFSLTEIAKANKFTRSVMSLLTCYVRPL